MTTALATVPQRTYRASRANVFWQCPGAAHDENDAVRINPVDDAGSMGSAVHETCANIVQGRPSATDAVALKFGFDDKRKRELEILTAIFAQFWSAYGHLFPNPLTEFALEADNLTGHVDLSACHDNVVRVLDIKTTRMETVNYRPQMMCYLYLLARNWEKLGWNLDPLVVQFQYVVLYLRDKTIETSQEMSAYDVQAWYDDYMRRLTEWDGRTYCPGGQCTYCRRAGSCPALAQKLTSTLSSVWAATIDEKGKPCTDMAELSGRIDALPDDECVAAYEKIRMAEKMLSDAVDLIKLRAESGGGTLNGVGKMLVMQDEDRDTILVDKARPIITKHMTDAEFDSCLRASKTDVLDIVGDKAPRGQKGEAKTAVMEELRAAGAVETKTIRKPQIKAALPGAIEKTIEGETLD